MMMKHDNDDDDDVVHFCAMFAIVLCQTT